MEIFEVEYAGQKIEVQKGENGSIFVSLPIRLGDRGSIFRETIVHEERGWRFTSTQDDDIEYYFHMWLKDNGCIAWANDMSYRIQEYDEPFNPNYPNAGVLDPTASKLYSIVKQIEAYQKRDMPTAELHSLRQYYLTTTLRLLGYDSIDAVGEEFNDSIGYLALNRVAKQLEDYRDISTLVHSIGQRGDEEVFVCTAPEDVDRKRALEFAKPVKEQIEDNVQFMQKQESDLRRKRAIVPGYKMRMSEKTGVYAWDDYENAVKGTALLLLELNADLLTPEQREKFGIPEFKIIDDLSLRDRISRLIDTKEFNDACRVEHEFAYEQSEELTKKAREMLQEIGEYDREDVSAKDLEAIIEEEIKDAENRKKSVDTHENLHDKYYSRKRRKTTEKRLDDEDYTY